MNARDELHMLQRVHADLLKQQAALAEAMAHHRDWLKAEAQVFADHKMPATQAAFLKQAAVLDFVLEEASR